MFPSQQVQFRTPNRQVKWSVSRGDLGSISPDGVFTAGWTSVPVDVVQISAWGDGPNDRAAVAMMINRRFGAPGASNWQLLLFVIMCGALGSMIHYVSSMVTFVGNRTFRSSWFWFYISRPFVGGGLAVIFFFALGSGVINGASGNQFMQLGLISALVGLFSDKAVKKLSDLLDVILATKDERSDKVSNANARVAPTAPESGGGAPKIDSVTPATLATNTAATIEVKGSGLAGCKVKLNGQDAAPTEQTAQGFKLAITEAQAQPPKVTIAVTTAQGAASFDVPVQ